MARPLPVNLLLAATGGILLVSGLGGRSIGDVLKGEFGNIEVKNPNIGSEGQTAGAAAATTSGEGGPIAPSPVSFQQQVPSGATFAPSPMNLGRHPGQHQTATEQAREIALILLGKNIHNPTKQQLAEARLQYEHEGGHKQLEGFADEHAQQLSPYV